VLQRFPVIAIALALASLLQLAACAGNAARPIPRTLGGASVPGAFVPPSAYEAYVRAELLLAEGRTREALGQLELASTAPDEDAYLLSRLAYAQLLSGDKAAALRTLEHAAKVDRCSEQVWLTRGAVAESESDFAAASRAYQHATECAPRSEHGELALARLLEQRGNAVAALDVLVRAAERPAAARVEPTLQRSLRDADTATFTHALDSLGLQRAPRSSAVQQAIRAALDRKLPRLALRLSEAHRASLPPALEAELLAAAGARARLAALLAQRDAAELGGRERTAELSLAAGAYERAELEATSALAEAPSDRLLALRARAALALGRPAQALPDIARIGAPELRRAMLLDALAASGADALASELTEIAARAPEP